MVDEKRGQVSLFMIIGAVILLVVLIVLLLQSEQIQIDNAVTVPPELLPAKSFLDYCADEAAQNALFILGRQGGFIYIRPEVRADPSRRLSFGGGAETIPYWYYEGRSWVPTIPYMEEELKIYINEAFMDCILNADFTANGFRLKRLDDNATTIVSINEEDVSVEIEFDAEISTLDGAISSKISQYYNIYDVRLADIMLLARYVLDYENRQSFVENITIDLMSISGSIPFSGMDVDCGVKTWYITDIKHELQRALFGTFDEIRVAGTDYDPFLADESVYEAYGDYADALTEAYNTVTLVDNFDEPGDYEKALNKAADGVGKPDEDLPADSYYYFHYLMPMLSSDAGKFSDLSVHFNYDPSYGMSIQAKPSSNGVLRSNSIDGPQKYLSHLCINIYHFVYDITYPVTVTLRDPTAFADRGYSFRFAFPVIVRNNEGLRSQQQMTFIPPSTHDDLYCQTGGGETVYVRAYDKTTGSRAPLADVNISMLCVNRKCPLGTTVTRGADAVLKTTMTSACSNPYLIAEKEGYFRGVVLADGVTQDEYDIEMVQVKEFDVEVVKHRVNPIDQTIGGPVAVTSGQTSLYITGFINDLAYEEATALFAGQSNKITLPIVDAEYDLSLTYLPNGQDFSGGYYGTWDVSALDLKQGNKIVFHVLETITPTLDEDGAAAVALLMNVSSSAFAPQVE